MKLYIAIILACLIATASPAQNVGGGGTVRLNQLERGTAGYVITAQGAGSPPTYTALAGAGIGDFSGPAAATDNAIVRFDGVGGKTGQNSVVTIADTTGAMTWPGNAILSAGSFTLTPTGAGDVAVPLTTGFVTVTKSSATTYITTNSTNGALYFYNPNTTASNAISLIFNGNDGTQIRSGAVISTVFSSRVNNTSLSGDLTFLTAGASAAPTEKARITGLGNVLIGGTTDIAGTGGIKVFGTTAATNSTSGSFINSGGFGNAGNLYVGGTINQTSAQNASTVLNVINSTAGTAARASFAISTDTTNVATLEAYSTLFTPAGTDAAADSARLLSVGAGGLSFRASHASGTIRFYTGAVNRLSIGTNGTATFTGNIAAGANLTVTGVFATAGSSPASTDTGTAGMIVWDASYIYVCTSTNVWKRAALSAY